MAIFIVLACLLSLRISGAEEKKGEKEESRIILMLPRIQEPFKGAFYLKLPEGVKYSYVMPSEWLSKIDRKGEYIISYARSEKGAKIATMEFPSKKERVKVAMAAWADAGPALVSGFGSIPVDVEKIMSLFKGFNVDIERIEVWVQGAVESGNIIRLFVSAKAEGGVKVILRPKKAD